METVNEIILTPHQGEKLDDILHEIVTGRKRIILSGSAGVGKTTLVNFLLKENITQKLTYIAAPTHKALSVLQQKIEMKEEEDPIVFCTVHKGLKLKMQINKRNGSKHFAQVFPKYDPPFDGCGLLIIDEASMLSQRMLDLLEQYNFPIIFLGDEKQINPVKEVDSPVFHQNWYTVTLTEIIRQAGGSPIIELSRNFSLIEAKMASLNGEGEDAEGFLFTGDRQKIIHKLAEINGTDDLKYLAWTNAEVDAINFSVRAHIYGNPDYIEEGEVLVLNNRYVINKEETLHNNYELKVEQLDIVDKPFHCENQRFDYKVYVINQEIHAIHEDHITAHKQNMKQLKAMAINRVIAWKSYYKFEEKFLDFKYNHAITVHKSQGSTYKDAIINIRNINLNRRQEEKQRLLYTAITRASRKVILYNV